MAVLPAHGRTLSVMSANLRYPARDSHPWAARLPVAAALIAAEAPHVIGTQEGRLAQLDQLVGRLPARYAWTGEGREGGDAGEFTAVIFDSRRLDAVSVDVSWISDTPDVPASRAPDAAHPRTLTRVDFRDRVGGGTFRLLNTHLDHRSALARPLAVDMLLSAAREALASGSEVIVTGDFNVAQTHEVWHRLTADAEGALADAVSSAPAAARTETDADTFHNYRGVRRRGTRIDWILHSPGLRCIGAATNTFTLAGAFPSDHFPVQACFAWSGRPEGGGSQ